MNTTVQKFKALLKAGKMSNQEDILKKCSLDEIRKFARALKTPSEKEIADRYFYQLEVGFTCEIIDALYKRRFERNLLLNREKFLKGLKF